ncbi:MAG: hypothetical protein ACKVQK_23590 [Burkholderiales bacterium]
MTQRDVYFTGTIPLANSAEVFTTVSRAVGPALRWLPDGETGVRQAWLPWLEPVFAEHGQFEPTPQRYQRVHEVKSHPVYRVKAGIDPASVVFHNLPYAQIAINSYRDFERLKKAGVIPARTRFQVGFAGVNSVIRRFVVEEQRNDLAPKYEQALIDQIQRIAAAIPKDQLAIQWDVASAVFQYIEAGEPCAHGQTRAEIIDHFSTWHARLNDAVPEGVDLLIHLCYGDAGHRHTIEPASIRWLVEFSNQLTAKTERSMQLIHMPVPRNRVDEAYYEALTELTLRPDTELALGLVHYTDGVEGTRARIAVAEKYRKEFALATECGFGRRDPATIPKLLEIHAAAAGLR